MEIHVHGTPDSLRDKDLHGGAVVVIDALRMTSVAATAIAGGCSGLQAVAEIEEAVQLAAQTDALLGGERFALPIEGFDLSNSPLVYTQARVKGRRIVITTSNGTRAILAAKAAKRVFLGAFVNACAVAHAVRHEPKLAIVCAGTLGAFTLEDALAAGAILDRLAQLGIALQRNDMAIATSMLYAASRGDLHAALSPTTHYQRLVSIGMQDDLDYCLTEDSLQAVPVRGEDGWFV